MKTFAFLALVGAVAASPCPYGQLAERGELSEADAAKFFAARGEGESAVESQMGLEKRSAEHAAQEQFYKRQVEARQLTLGGGLLTGALQPFTGVLAGLDVPTPQATGLARVPDAEHPYEAPGSTDVRGMCPTLNTMANHGYISRNGITTFAEAANACQITLGFGYDTCVFLSALGLLSGGDLPSGKYSIGGADSRVPDTLGPSLGISHHGFFEVDNSISRQDAYFGNQANFQMDLWEQLVGIADKYDGEFGNSAFAEERVLRYNQAKNSNPEFDAGIRWLAVTTAERVFIFRALPNGTHDILADYRNVAPFYLNETFPDNWFRRDNAYSLADTGADIADLLVSSSEVTTPGQNEGLNNFVPLGIDLGAVTPTSATCFLASAVFDETPGFLSPALVDNYDVVQAFLNGAVAPFFAAYNCETSFGTPGPDAGNGVAGPDTTCNVLVNGEYQC
ncbi:aromatic peroxygenase-like [Teratosphaeria destructans]|uniref:Aromatic peroxygenase-like n=1 Tax=Teratosphaeria destructans TaxID=418781 RepID=A0A9W7T0C3_9PEZI|nr:aromatic peroxygenase-like [Teratosphaeria destructans]